MKGQKKSTCTYNFLINKIFVIRLSNPNKWLDLSPLRGLAKLSLIKFLESIFNTPRVLITRYRLLALLIYYLENRRTDNYLIIQVFGTRKSCRQSKIFQSDEDPTSYITTLYSWQKPSRKHISINILELQSINHVPNICRAGSSWIWSFCTCGYGSRHRSVT